MASEEPAEFIGEKDWFFLYWIAYYRYKDNRPISSSELLRNLESQNVKCSQQTVSRRSKELESLGYLQKIPQNQKILLDLTPKAMVLLNEVYGGLEFIVAEFHSSVDEFSGELGSGMGEGGYYIEKPLYLSQFTRELGYKPFFGTLNVKVEHSEFEILQNH